MAAILGEPIGLMAEARLNPARMPVALISLGFILSTAAAALMIFKAPGGVLLRLHGDTSGYVYYGILGGVVIWGFAEASFGYWVVPRDPDGWHAAGKTLLWVSLLPLVLVFALGGLAFLK
ncbi:hypothetical protein HU200_052700 [Digitaria exilis]|uniref:Uncharacterized protein n=1 Tax=Digitaria exilis TaxID=1010633 RepID=A0A835AN59_9POAL|nr:hypothetical protein HU200_052700 [Digitaria exilis]